MASERLLRKLKELLSTNDFYEAHQIYRTLYHRMMRANRKRELSTLLYDGAINLLRKEQHNSGADLACLYLDVMSSMDAEDVRHVLSCVRNLFELIPPKTPERLTFVSKAIKLKVAPLSAIHKQFAIVLWKEKNFIDSRIHFAHSNDSGDDCALMLVEYQTTFGFNAEVDLFIAQFVFQVLCVRNKSMADQTFHAYTSRHPSICSPNPPFLLPLLNFLWFLLLAIDSGKSTTFKVLCDTYGTSLKRDPSYNDYLSQIGQIYFGLENANKSRGGLFGNFIQSLLDGGDESDDESVNVSAGPSHRNCISHDVELD